MLESVGACPAWDNADVQGSVCRGLSLSYERVL